MDYLRYLTGKVYKMLQYHYTDTELKAILKTLTVLVDTREQKNAHITKYLIDNNIPIKSRKLDFGDYSFLLPVNPDMGIMRDIYFDNILAIERKNSLEELSGTLTARRHEFECELIRGSKAKMLLMVENSSLEDIITGRYRTQFNSTSFLAALKTYEIRYNLSMHFIPKLHAGHLIHTTCHYFLREYLKGVA